MEGPRRIADPERICSSACRRAAARRVIAGCERVRLASMEEPRQEPERRILRSVYRSRRQLHLDLGADGLDPFPRRVSLCRKRGFYGISVALGMTELADACACAGARLGLAHGSSGAFRRERARTRALRDCVDRYIFVTMAQLSAQRGMQPLPRRAAAGRRAHAHDGRPRAFAYVPPHA